MKIALDTNILAYAEQVQRSLADATKVSTSRSLLRSLLADINTSPVAPGQALLELHHVLTRKGGRSPEEARAAVQAFMTAMEVAATTPDVIESAMALASLHGLQIFDSVILAASAAAGCDILVSEDLQDGVRFNGVVVTNPFGPKPHPAVLALISNP